MKQNLPLNSNPIVPDSGINWNKWKYRLRITIAVLASIAIIIGFFIRLLAWEP